LTNIFNNKYEYTAYSPVAKTDSYAAFVCFVTAVLGQIQSWNKYKSMGEEG